MKDYEALKVNKYGFEYVSPKEELAKQVEYWKKRSESLEKEVLNWQGKYKNLFLKYEDLELKYTDILGRLPSSKFTTIPSISADIDFNIQAHPSNTNSLIHAFVSTFDAKLYKENDTNRERNMIVNSMRKLIAHYLMKKHNKLTKQDLLKMDLDEYIKYLEDERTWPGELEMSILAEHFNIQICVFSFIRDDIHIKKIPNNYGKGVRMYLIDNTNGSRHYDQMIAKNNVTQEYYRIFSTDDERAAKACLKQAEKTFFMY